MRLELCIAAALLCVLGSLAVLSLRAHGAIRLRWAIAAFISAALLATAGNLIRLAAWLYSH